MSERSGNLTAADGTRLFWRSWEPEAPVGSIILVHGTNEHLGRYLHVAEFFTQQGFAVYGLDQRGFGQSEGARCYVDRFSQYLEDLRLFIEQLNPPGPRVLIGHSLGGLIAYRYALEHPESIQALVISSPMFAVKAKVNPVTQALTPIISALLPKLQIAADLPENICRDPEVVQAYVADPLVWKKVTPRWFVECTRAGQECVQGVTPGLRLPALFLQAGDDLLVDPEATRKVHTHVPHERKAFKLYPGKYHEIFNDPGKEEVFTEILSWIGREGLIPQHVG